MFVFQSSKADMTKGGLDSNFFSNQEAMKVFFSLFWKVEFWGTADKPQMRKCTKCSLSSQ